MAELDRTVAALRVFGETLCPQEITEALGCQPTKEQVKGQVFTSQRTGRERTAKFGMWRLVASDASPGNLDAQIAEILDQLNPDGKVWSEISAKYEIDLFCGLFMEHSNEGLTISPESLAALGQRNIEIGLDIYGPDDE